MGNRYSKQGQPDPGSDHWHRGCRRGHYRERPMDSHGWTQGQTVEGNCHPYPVRHHYPYLGSPQNEPGPFQSGRRRLHPGCHRHPHQQLGSGSPGCWWGQLHRGICLSLIPKIRVTCKQLPTLEQFPPVLLMVLMQLILLICIALKLL